MSPDYWQKIKLILDDALVQPPTARSGYLAAVCGADQTLRRDVESLLAFEDLENEDDALESSAMSLVGEPAIPENSFIGKVFGNYKITEKLGEGGMGAVFLAIRDDGEFRQRAAIKVIRQGVNSEAVLQRFLNERQILAELEYPNIARLIDGGTTADGMPFLVMEYVEGTPVNNYAADKNLSLNERLELFRQICAAVAYAHKNLVIHRDLKPSNILVTTDGTPKLLDFGIAKLLKTGDSDETQTRQFAFTPDYASPEQVRGEKLTTATDVYSLGVILYELLTGTRPYRTGNCTIGEVMRMVCETTPERPSAVAVRHSPLIIRPLTGDTNATNENQSQNTTNDELKSKDQRPKTKDHRALRGDLDNIILKSLRKEPERRYSSVEQFAEDIRRHQNGLPVSARRDTWNYRTSKFIQRNRVAVAFAALVVLALVGGIFGTTWQSIRAERERRAADLERTRAEQRFENLREISNSLVGEIERAIRDLPGSLPARQMLLARAVEQLDQLAADADGNSKLQLELAWAYQNLGALPDRKLSERNAMHQKAVALVEKVIAAEPRNNEARDRLAMIYLDLIFASRLRGDVDYTVEYNRRAVELIEDVLRDAPNDKTWMRESVWTVYYHQMLTLQQLGKATESANVARKILPIAEELYREQSPGSTGYAYMNPHLTRAGIGYGLNFAGDYRAAVTEYEKALAECRAEMSKRPEADILRRNEANIRLQLSTALENLGEAEAALNHAETALDIRTKMATSNPKDLDFQIAQADTELFTGQMLTRQNKSSIAVPRFRRALVAYEKMSAIDDERMQVKILIARTKSSLGDALATSGNVVEGTRFLREAVVFYESINAGKTIDAQLKRFFAKARAELGSALAKSRKPENLIEARENYQQSLALWRDLQTSNTLRRSDASLPDEISRRLNELSETN